ncbi:MAG TPA: hypothetical protein VGD73_33080 [Pseudonocardia sp.]|jgi:hypothetical protein|uniref:hypothetical protein n=1 Tax=Pseudonocardia sp. TaxID=60912 RepID=UPI002EDB08D4
MRILPLATSSIVISTAITSAATRPISASNCAAPAAPADDHRRTSHGAARPAGLGATGRAVQ